MTAPSTELELHRAQQRFATDAGWLTSRHSFSFGHHYDPENIGHGLLLVNNDDIVQAGTGFSTHPHQDMEIVTWVLDGSLVHQDSEGNADVIYPGLAQRMSAGHGILHSEKNDSWRLRGDRHTDPVHFVQMWVLPDERGAEPGYEQTEISDTQLRSGLIPVASGMARDANSAAIWIRQRDAALHAARLRVGEQVSLPDAPYVHLFIPRGAVALEGAGDLGTGDAVRLTGAGARRITATDDSEILVWEMNSSLTG